MYCREVVVVPVVQSVVMEAWRSWWSWWSGAGPLKGGQEAHGPSMVFCSMWLLLVLHTLGSDQQPYISMVSLAAR